MDKNKHQLTIFVALLLAGTAIGAITNGLLNLGDSVIGEIKELDQEDTFVFSALADTRLSMWARAAGPSKTLHPRLRVTDLSTNTLLVDASNTKFVTIKKLILPSSGQYQLSISGAQDTLGLYKLKTDEKVSWDTLSPKGWDTTPGGGQLDVAFESGAGWSFDATVEPKSKGVFMSTPTLTSPSGFNLDLTDYILKDGPLVKVRDLPLPEFGLYEFAVANTGLTGLVKWHITLDPDDD